MEVVYIVVLLALLAFWWDNTQCNERALSFCRQLCERADVQLLDGTIVRQRMWLRRVDRGVQLCRLYSFDFSGDNESRNCGYIVMLGRQVVESHMEPWRVS